MLYHTPSKRDWTVSKPVISQQETQGLKGAFAPLDRNSLEVKIDYRKVFNLMVTGLFEGIRPPYLASRLEDVPFCIKSYEEVAKTLRSSSDVDGYYRFNQAASLLKKLEGVPIKGLDPTGVALDGYLQSEEICRQTNAALWDMFKHPLSYVETDLTRLIVEMRGDIAELLGDEPPSLDDVLGFGNFGPGTSLTNKVGQTDPVLKLVNPSCLTSLRLELFSIYAKSLVGDAVFSARTGIKNTANYRRKAIADCAMDGTEFSDHAVLGIVPKNMWTGRSIEIGGCMTTWIQQCFDGYIRSALKRVWGLDLQNQLPNRHMAFLGSMRDAIKRFCTIDLTSASDRIALVLVALLLPPKWFALLYRMTNRRTLIPKHLDGGSNDRVIKLEKFSAMGNSLTFALQTLIFGSLVRAKIRAHGSNTGWRVYGDDIIVEEPVYEAVMTGLRLLGFEPNPNKSYSTGFFRESCGADYFLGTDVRALYIKEPIRWVPDLYKYLNLIQAHVRYHPERVNFWRPLYAYLWGKVPATYKVVGIPSRCLDGYVWSPFIKGISSELSYPKVIISKGSPGDRIPEPFDRLKVLMSQHAGDSSLRCKPGDELPLEVELNLWSKQTLAQAMMKIRRKNSPPVVLSCSEVWHKVRAGMALTPLQWGEEEGGINPLAL